MGRANLPANMRGTACLLYDVSEWIKSTETAEPGLRKAFALINDVLVAENFLRSADKPRYVHYTNMRLLDRYLLASRSRPLAKHHGRARRALAIIMRDWFEFEQERLSAFDDDKLPKGVIGYTFEDGDQDDPVSHLRERVRTLDVLAELAAVADLPDTRMVRKGMAKYPSDWEYFADDPDRELAHFLCLPRSTWHDEVMFLRMIHATECCFPGILASLETLPTLALGGTWLAATPALKEATYFS
ncbi:hypothetical protein, partial [Azospirillum sp. B506]|uniref:hypothetical protein n=1 Tax=Azospirillum sp. B506 TaxID=137721 RepID=UPI0011DD055C